MIDHGMEPQAALDAARFIIYDGEYAGKVFLEEGISPETIRQLRAMGHHTHEVHVEGYDRSMFGRGQIIRVDAGVRKAGSDPRGKLYYAQTADLTGDGMAIGYCVDT